MLVKGWKKDSNTGLVTNMSGDYDKYLQQKNSLKALADTKKDLDNTKQELSGIKSDLSEMKELLKKILEVKS